MRAPVSRSRRLCRPGGLPVGDVALVGEFGLLCQRAFGVAHGRFVDQIAVVPWAFGARAVSSRRPSFFLVNDGWP